MAFSPGEYFGDKLSIKDAIKNYDKPLFVASASYEAPQVKALIDNVKTKDKSIFTPSETGEHGSKILWKEIPGNQACWAMVISFLSKLDYA